MNRTLPSLLLASVLVSTLYGAIDSDGCRSVKDYYYGERERGWFWNEAPCTPRPKDENKTASKKNESDDKYSKYKLIPKKVDIPWEIIDQIDPEQIAEMERTAQKTALMYPTDHNVKEHRMLQRFAVKKSIAYAKAGDQLGRADRDLAEWRSDVPTSSIARTVSAQKKYSDMGEILRNYSEKAGLVVVTQQGCGYCEKQIPILDTLKMETGFTYKNVDISQIPVAAQRLGVANTPDIFLVLNKGGKAEWRRVASGLNTLSELKQSIVLGLYGLGELKSESAAY